MVTFLSQLSILEAVYWAAAILGGVLFVVRLLLMLIGGFADFGGDVGDAAGIDLGDPGGVDPGSIDVGHPGDTVASFNLFSFQGIAAFFMMFGLSGLTLLSTGIHQVLVILGSLSIGVFAMWVISQLYRQAYRLQSDGTVDIRNAVGQTGRVYLRIPSEGTGQVQVAVQERMREFDAVSADQSPIASGEFIVVEAILDQRTLVVRKK